MPNRPSRNTSTQAQESTNTYSQTFTVDQSMIGGWLGTFTADLKVSNMLTWTTDAQSSVTTSTASLSVRGPSCNNAVTGVGPCIPVYDSAGNQPTQFEVYQDNLYGTFMFAPITYY